MNAVLLRGSSRVEPGAYREVRTGHIVYMASEGYLPGQINSEHYVKVPDRLYFLERTRRMLREHESA